MTTAAPKFETREAWMNAFAQATRSAFEAAGFPLPATVRVSIGWPSGGRRSKAIGECFPHGWSKDKHFEIFIHPGQQSNSSRVADILTHELVHAAVGLDAKHGPRFRKCAKALGLVGKMTATLAGPDWHAWADSILADMGPMPGADLGYFSQKKKAATRLLKVECDSCGIIARVTKKVVDQCDGLMRCLDHDCDGELRQEGEGGGELRRAA